MKKLVFAFVVAALAAAPAGGAPAKAASVAMTPAQAIAAAAKQPEAGAEGVFEFPVGSLGGGGGKRPIFVNSAADYHDPRNLSVMLRAEAVHALEAKLGGPLAKTLPGKRITVTGTARQVTIVVYKDKKKTGETYVQTRIEVRAADRILVK